jgi:hypothetical protein
MAKIDLKKLVLFITFCESKSPSFWRITVTLWHDSQTQTSAYTNSDVGGRLLLSKPVLSPLQTTVCPPSSVAQTLTLTARDVCHEIIKLPNFVAGWYVMPRNWLHFVHIVLSWLHTHRQHVTLCRDVSQSNIELQKVALIFHHISVRIIESSPGT